MPRKKNPEPKVGGIVAGLHPALMADSSLAHYPLSVRVSGNAPMLGTLDVTTFVLENTLGHLEALRLAIERDKRKEITDVRDFADMEGARILAGVEHPISYVGLVDLITHWKQGIAARRLKVA